MEGLTREQDVSSFLQEASACPQEARGYNWWKLPCMSEEWPHTLQKDTCGDDTDSAPYTHKMSSVC